MKTMHVTISGLCAAAAVAGFAPRAYAFHSGGVAECVGCHTPHNGSTTPAGSTNPGNTSGPYLLLGSDQSSTCLNCHQHQGDTGPSSYHVSTATADMPAGSAPKQRGPGGDFGWLKKDYTDTCRGGAIDNKGFRRGHSIVATDYGYTADTENASAPGGGAGAYAAGNLGCTSCHDPHNKYRRVDEVGTIVANTATAASLPIIGSGSYDTSAAVGTGGVTWGAVGVYRILGGPGYSPKSTGFAFTAPNPQAIAPATYNRTEATTDTRVAYGKGMSEWCANCHSEMHNGSTAGGSAGLVHPAGSTALLGSVVTANYNAYVKSGNLTGTNVSSYSSLVPYEEGSTDIATLKGHAKAANANKTGPSTGTENVMCLSCHRAHASGFVNMTRWFMENEFMTIAQGGTTGSGTPIYANPQSAAADNNGCIAWGLTQTEQSAAYYDRPATVFAPYQRSMCNKCHAKD